MISRVRATAPGLRVADVLCGARRGSLSEEEASSGWTLVMPYRGVFVWQVEGRRIVADPNTVLLFASDQPHRVFHPADGGDACVAIALSDEWAEWITPAGSRVRQHWVLDGRSQRAVHALAHHVGLHVDALETEEAVALVASALTSAREAPKSNHRMLVDAVRERIASDPSAKLLLPDLASEFGMSRFELARRFRAHTGSSIHQYLVRLRLITVLGRLREGESDLTRLAIESGFGSHSHLTSAFTKAFGKPPSAARDVRSRTKGDFGSSRRARWFGNR